MPLHIDSAHVIPDHELVMSAMKASGPGGQHVNTTDSAVEVRWYLEASGSFDDDEKRRLRQRLGHRITKDGALIVRASEHRSQHRNRQAALDRLQGLLVDALRPRTKRRPTRPTRASRERRLNSKRQRGETKRLRGSIDPPD